MKGRIILAGTLVGLGGVETHLRWLGRALTEAGWEVMSMSFSPTPRDAGKIAEIEGRYAGTEVFFVDRTGFGTSALGRFLAVKTALRRFQPDVYLACGTGWNLYAPAALSVGKRPRRVFHEVMSGEASGWRDSRWLVRGRFDEVVAQAEPVAQNFRRAFRLAAAHPGAARIAGAVRNHCGNPGGAGAACAAGYRTGGFFQPLGAPQTRRVAGRAMAAPEPQPAGTAPLRRGTGKGGNRANHRALRVVEPGVLPRALSRRPGLR